MTNGFVQENPRPARPEDHFHWPSRRIDSSKLENCLSRAFARDRFRVEIPSEDIESLTAAAPLIPRLTPASLFSDAHDIQPHQRLMIPCSIAVRSDNENVFRFVDVACLYLFNTRVEDASSPIGFLQERYFLGNLQFCGKYSNRVQIPFLIQRRRNSDSSALRRCIRDKSGSASSLDDVLPIQILRIRVACLLARDHSYTDPQTYAFRSALNDLLLENDGVIDPVLEVKIGIVSTSRQCFTEVGFKVSYGEVVSLKKNRFSEFHLTDSHLRRSE